MKPDGVCRHDDYSFSFAVRATSLNEAGLLALRLKAQG
jgi:hypothetical protein